MSFEDFIGMIILFWILLGWIIIDKIAFSWNEHDTDIYTVTERLDFCPECAASFEKWFFNEKGE